MTTTTANKIQAPKRGAGEPGLGRITINRTPYADSGVSGQVEAANRRIAAHALLGQARRLLLADFYSDSPVLKHRTSKSGSKLSHRTSWCRRRAVPGSDDHPLLYFRESRVGRVGHVWKCGSLGTCPVCAETISERRRAMLNDVYAARGGKAVMITLTMRHTRQQGLQSVRDLISEAFKRLMVTGKAARGFCRRWGIVGRITAHETTYGVNGWHPHLHVAVDFDRKLSEVNLDELKDELIKRWCSIVENLGGYASPAWSVDVSVQADPAYLAKLGFEHVRLIDSNGQWNIAAEMTKAPTKTAKRGGLSPKALLAVSLSGQTYFDPETGLTVSPGRAGELWIEYAATTYRAKHLMAAGTLRAAMKTAGDKSDEELADEDTHFAEVMGTIRIEDYLRVVGNDAVAELENEIGTGDPERVRLFLAALAILFTANVEFGDDPEPPDVVLDLTGPIRVMRSRVDLDSMTVTETVEEISRAEYQCYLERDGS